MGCLKTIDPSSPEISVGHVGEYKSQNGDKDKEQDDEVENIEWRPLIFAAIPVISVQILPIIEVQKGC